MAIFMYSVAVTAPGRVELVKIGLPAVGEYDALVKTELSFICNATDGKIIQYHMPGLGAESYPLVLGHETVGRVVQVGARVQNFKPGDRAIGGLVLEVDGPYGSGWGGHSEYTLIRDIRAMLKDGTAPKDYNETYKIMSVVPDDIPIEAAGLLCTWREVYSGFFHDFGAHPDQSVLIFGAGPVGLSFTRFASIAGFRRIVTVEPLAEKRKAAKALGAHEVLAPDEVAGYAEQNGKFDLVIDAVGRPAIINTALSLIRLGGSVCIFGVLGEDAFTLQKCGAPYNFNLLFHQWPTRDYEYAAQEPLVEWIRSGKLDHAAFVTARYNVKDIALAMEAAQKPTSIKTMLLFDSAERTEGVCG